MTEVDDAILSLELDEEINEEPPKKLKELKEENPRKASIFFDQVLDFLLPNHNPFPKIDDDYTYVYVDESESEQRITNFFLYSSFILVQIAGLLTLIAFILRFASSSTQLKPWDLNKHVMKPALSQHLAIIDRNGNVYDLKIEQSFQPSWTMKLPKSHDYFAFTNDRKVYVAYGDVRKKMTYLKSNKFHRRVPKSQVPFQDRFFRGAHVHIGNFIWLLIGPHSNEPVINNHCKFRN